MKLVVYSLILFLIAFIEEYNAVHTIVHPFIVNENGNRVPWTEHKTTRFRRSSSVPLNDIEIILAGSYPSLHLNLHPNRNLITSNTVIEWIGEDGDHTVTEGLLDSENCWYSGHVDSEETRSLVALSICNGLQGLIQTSNETMFLEPLENGSAHVLYSANYQDISLANDQAFPSRRKRNVDYDQEGNEITDTAVSYYEISEEEPEMESHEDLDSSEEDDNKIIIDDYWEIDNVDVHEGPQVTEVEFDIDDVKNPSVVLQEKENQNKNGTEENEETIDGYPVDKLWEVPEDMLPQESKRKKPTSKSAIRADPPKWLEMVLAVDHTVIKFHGKPRVQQYVLTLLNIVSAIYEDPSLEANIRLVVSKLIFFEDRKYGQVREGNSKRSLENVNAWNAALLRSGATENPHDIAVWLTRLDLGGPSGYAPVSGVCDPDRSCSLNRDEGLTSSFIIAHEVGHVLGFSHDGDMSSGNDCSTEALQGSVMAPMVAATFSRFHWSRCTHWEYHFKQQNWNCLRNEPNGINATIIQSTIQNTYSLDEQCRMEFGEGYSLCRSFALSDPCTHLWCGHRSSPQLCKTKKGPPLEGTPCAHDKWCIKGVCELISKRRKVVGPVRKNPRDGGWSEWSPWNSCSRTCGTGARFRTRKCDNPAPLNGGKSCEGPGEEFELCNEFPCRRLTDIRDEQCSLMPSIITYNSSISRLTWQAWELNNQSVQCQLTCRAKETGDIYRTGENVIDGTPCSYENPHAICIQGKCYTVGCDRKLGSRKLENECGICGASSSNCTVVTRNLSKKPRKPFLKLAIIPRGARNIQIFEDSPTQHQVNLQERKSKSMIFPLNSVNQLVYPQMKSDVVVQHSVSGGTRFTYNNVYGVETIRGRGPLLHDITLVVFPGDSNELVNITATWTLPLRSRRQVAEEARYAWDNIGWSPCSTSCGGGVQAQVWQCRDRKTGGIVRRKHCLILEEPQPLTRPCNTFSCDYRWVTGDWEGCSRTCGSDGEQMRMVYCIRTKLVHVKTQAANRTSEIFSYDFATNQSEGFYEQVAEANRKRPEVVDIDESENFKNSLDNIDTWRPTTNDFKKKIANNNEVLSWDPKSIADPALCRDDKPAEVQPCNRIPCPGTWKEKFWTKCSSTCGPGYQELTYSCKLPRGPQRKPRSPVPEIDIEDYEEEGNSLFSFTNTTTDCGTKPFITRYCSAGNCPHKPQISECSDQSVYCALPVLSRYCTIQGFRKTCCRTCTNYSLF